MALGKRMRLCFSVPKGVPAPPSLQNIFKELAEDLKIPQPGHGCLMKWAQQGVMLLNATLTVKQGEPMSHHGQGWELWTDAVISKLCEREGPLAIVLWGKSAQDKCKRIKGIGSKASHYLLKAGLQLLRHSRLTRGLWAAAIFRRSTNGSHSKVWSRLSGVYKKKRYF